MTEGIDSSFDLLLALKKLHLLESSPSWWWQNHGSFEVVISAILVQNTQWEKVQKMLDSMRSAGILSANPQKDSQKDLEYIASIESQLLASHIIGLQMQKSTRIVRLACQILKDFGSFESFQHSVDSEWLLQQKGIGLESAYAILNYACLREVMVVDRYTYKLLCALGWEIENYEELREFCERGIRENLEEVYKLYPSDMSLAQIFARFHGKIVEFSKAKLSPALLQ
ncbi:3-methyladenine DNA glycosylase [Helicobacter sp. MIT 05-5293]|nr:3-methyladenine DNA glycosylase [Helicobacter sp. MIT 05-5293]